ncbi:MAG: hypothetical protein CME06_10020 [Gemmatimonadetes bacterium]|nr:hypothetical protein [Gemmatimonadota bacterium]
MDHDEQSPDRLINQDFVDDVILENARWNFTHGAASGFMGFGILYYALVYSTRARVVVCLGSGDGFVPRIFRQAQRDLGDGFVGRTILVDGNVPEKGFGAPDYLAEDSFFRTRFPDVEMWIRPTEEAAQILAKDGIEIDLLHIDADHTIEGVMADYRNFRPLLSDRFVITMHDTRFSPGVVAALEQIRATEDVDLIDFNHLGYGLAVLKPRVPNGDVASVRMKAGAFLRHPKPHLSARMPRWLQRLRSWLSRQEQAR